MHDRIGCVVEDAEVEGDGVVLNGLHEQRENHDDRKNCKERDREWARDGLEPRA
jgi:hypothetical protein